MVTLDFEESERILFYFLEKHLFLCLDSLQEKGNYLSMHQLFLCFLIGRRNDFLLNEVAKNIIFSCEINSLLLKSDILPFSSYYL